MTPDGWPAPLPLFDDDVVDGESLDRHVTSQARPVDEHAHARRSDPETSHAAAASLSIRALRASQLAVVAFLRELGPLTLEQLVDAARVNEIPLSDSRLRTACAELVDLGFVADSGERLKTRHGRDAAVWILTTEGEDLK